MKAAGAAYCLATGLLMVGWWANDLRRGAWQRSDRSHAELGLHLAAEFMTAVWLLGAGLTYFAIGRAALPFEAVALGMLLYTTIVSPGYFVARRETAVVVLFGVLIVTTSLSLAAVLV